MQIPQIDYAMLIALTYGLIETVKKIDVKEKLNRFLPLISIIIGLGLGVASNIPVIPALTIGLAASGLYRGIKVTVLKE